MKNVFGNSITATLFGESHGPAVGIVLDGLPAGLPVDFSSIKNELAKRQSKDKTSTARHEKDDFSILSGVFKNYTTGTPLTIVIKNEDVDSGSYQEGIARPGHADFVAHARYNGFEDYRGGGHFSGRITAALVAAGGILIPALENLDIKIGTHILECGGAKDLPFQNLPQDIDFLQEQKFPVLDFATAEKMTKKILAAAKEQNSVGGITQTAICGLPVGLGEPWFDSFESMLAHALFSLGGVKGVEFGLGFAFAKKKGSEANDSFVVKNGKVQTTSNNNGGINGGLTNGMPVLFQCVMKPTASIGKEQKTIDFLKNKNTKIKLQGRHDPAIIRRICPVIDSVAAFVTADFLCQRFGTDALLKKEMLCNLV